MSKKPRKDLTKYEKEINKFIPVAVEHANNRIVELYPIEGPRIAGGHYAKYKGKKLHIAKLPVKEREAFEKCFDSWNTLFHVQMNKLTREAGLRV